MQNRETSDEDVALLAQVFDAINRGGIKAALEFAHPEIEFQDAGLITPRRTLHGRAPVLAHMGVYEASFQGLKYAPIEFLRRGEAVAVPTHVTGRGRTGDVELVLTPVFWVRAGKVIRAAIYTSRDEAMRAVPASAPHRAPTAPEG